MSFDNKDGGPIGHKGASVDKHGWYHTLTFASDPMIHPRPFLRISLPAKTLLQPWEGREGR